MPRSRLRLLLPAIGGCVALAAAGGATSSAVAAEAAKTRVYVVVLDGLRPDEVALMPFLSSLADSGTYYTEARSVMVAETIPNHVAMVTGTYPDRNGIVANNFPVPGENASQESGDPSLLQSDSVFTLVADQCPELTAAAVTSKDYLFTVMDHDRNGDGEVDADSNFANVDDPSFIPGLGLTLDERTMPEVIRVSREEDPDFLFANLGSIDRTGHVDPFGGATAALPTGAAPAVRISQLGRTDTLLRGLVTELQQSDRWDNTAFVVTTDHSMDFSVPTAAVTLADDIEADSLLTGRFAIAQNGGAALYSLIDRADPQASARLARLREIAVGTDGVDEALYRQPNPADGGQEHWVGAVHPDWHQTGPRSGDLLLTVQDGRRVSEPTPVSNPIPGNHGMTSTLRIPLIVNGGLAAKQRVSPAAPLTGDVRALEQAENVDIAPTAAWLLGAQPPAAGFDGRALAEAFPTRPAAVCGSNLAAGPDPVPSPGPSAGGASDQPGGASTPAPGAGTASEAGTRTAAGRLPATGAAGALAAAAGLVLLLALGMRRRTRV